MPSEGLPVELVQHVALVPPRHEADVMNRVAPDGGREVPRQPEEAVDQHEDAQDARPQDDPPEEVGDDGSDRHHQALADQHGAGELQKQITSEYEIFQGQ